uniref:Uncharacterized protein n=1 Tax=Lepeophtheirus salmonis TaxID=72036 RepID=A0A0K2VIL6_LEPSM
MPSLMNDNIILHILAVGSSPFFRCVGMRLQCMVYLIVIHELKGAHSKSNPVDILHFPWSEHQFVSIERV